MKDDDKEPNLVNSSKSMRVAIDGYRLSIEIFRLEEEQDWTLEVVDPEGTSHVWDDRFVSDGDARDTALKEIEKNGPLAFMRGDNVVPFDRK